MIDRCLPRLRRVALSAAVLLLPAVASASHVRGIRITVTNVDSSTRTVDIDLTAYTVYGETGGPTAEEAISIAEAGPGISWGEGETIATTEIEFDSASSNRATFRKSFSHSYETDGPFTITALSSCCGGPAERIDEEGPGAYAGEAIFTPITETEAEYYGSPELSQIVDHFRATAQVQFLQSVLEIPTASTVGLALLSLALAGAGFWLIRR